MASRAANKKMLPAHEAPHLATPKRCPHCGFEGSLHRVERDELVQAGGDVALVRVLVDECEHCGERVFDLRTVADLEAVAARLRGGDLRGLTPAGTVYRAASS